MAQKSKTLDIQVQGVTKTIQLWNEEGTDILSTYEVLEQIAQYWEDMSDAEKTALAISQAGKNQIDVYTSTLNNFNAAIRAKTTALLADGSAEKENEAAMSGLEKQTKAVQAEFENFVLSLPIEQVETQILSLTKAFLAFINNGVTQGIIKVVAITTVITGLIGGVKTLATLIPHFISNAIAGITSLAVAQNGLNASLATGQLLIEGIGILMETNPLFLIGTAVAAVTALVLIVEKLNVSFEEATENLQEINQAVNETETNIKDLKDKLAEIEEQIEAINGLKLSVTDEDELKSLQRQQNALERQSAELQNQLDIEKAKLEIQREQQKEAAQSAMNKQTGGTIYNVDLSGQKGVGGQVAENAYSYTGTGFNYAQKLIEGLNATQEKIHETREQMKGLSEDSQEYLSLKDDLEDYNDEWNEMNAEIVNILPNIQAIITSGEDISGVFQGIFDAYHEIVEEKKESADIGSVVSEEDTDTMEEEAEAAEELADGLKNVQSAYDDLKSAVDEYNEKGHFTAETIEKIANMSPEYLAALVKEGDQYKVNVDLLSKKFEAEKQEAILKLKVAKQLALAQLAEEYLQKATENETTAVITSAKEAQNAVPKYNELANAAKNAGDKMQEVHDKLMKNGNNDVTSWEQYQHRAAKIIKSYDDQIKAIENSELDLSTSAKSSAGSHKDAWVQAFEEEKDALKNLLETDQIKFII